MNTVTPRPPLISRLPLRFLLAVALVLAVLAYVLPLAATRIIGQDILRAQAQEALASALARPVDIKGDVLLTMIPWFGLRTGLVSVANDPGFGPEPLLSVSSVTIGLNLPALISKKIVVTSISLSSPSLNLGRNAAGIENWRPRPAETAAQAEQADNWKVESLPSGLRLLNAHLTYTDHQTGISFELRRLNLNTSQSRPFDFSLSCEMTVNPWGVTGELHVQGVGSYGANNPQVFVHKSQAMGWLELPPGAGLPGERVNYSGRVMVHGEGGAFEVANLMLDGLGARLTGQLNVGGLYGDQPYIFLNLAAKADRRGSWTKLLGLDLAGRALTKTRSVKEEPSFLQPPPTGDIEASVELSSTPSGWMARNAVVRDGPGKISGLIKNIDGDLSFDIAASNWDLNSWLPVKLLHAPLSASELKTVRGRFSGSDLRVGTLEITDMELSARGEQGDLRIYPFTAKAQKGLLTSDIRIKSGPESSTFSGTSRVQALSPEPANQGPLPTVAELNVDGEYGPRGISGKARLGFGDFLAEWKPVWLSKDALKVWSLLGQTSASASFTFPTGRGAAWEMPDLDVKTSYSHITGKASGGRTAAVLDLQADRLDLDRLLQLEAFFTDAGAGYSPWPVEAKVAAKRFTALGIGVEDLLVALRASPDALKVSTVSGAMLGGKFLGGVEIESSRGKKNMALNLSVSGIQSGQLSALWPEIPKMNGPIACRLTADSSVADGPSAPLWHGLHGQADLQMGQGSVVFSPDQGVSQPWPVSKASASLKFSTKSVTPQAGDHPREAVLADLAGTLKLDSPGVIRSSQMEIKGQTGLASSGKPLWFRQPKVEGVHTLALPFTPPGKTARAFWSGKFEADLDKGSFAFSGVNLNLAGVPGRATFSGQPAQGGLTLAGNVDIPEFSPRDAAQHMGLAIPAGAHPNVWRRAKLSLDVGGNLKEVQLSRIQATLDDAVITGQAAVTGAKTRLDLAVSTLDMDRLAPSPQYLDPTKRPSDPLPLAQLRELSLEAMVRFGWLIKDRLVWENALTEFTAQAGRFHLRQTAPTFYGGPYLMDIKGDARGQELKAQIELKLVNFSAAQLLTDLAGGASLTKGMCDFSVNVDTRGTTDRDLRRHATGSAKFQVRDGKLAIKEASGRQPAPAPPPQGDRDAPPAPAPQSDGLSFSSLGASFSVREGLGVTRDFSLVGGGIVAKGDGWVSLDDEKIDLNLVAAVPDVGDVPVRISGSLYDPKMDIDKSKVLGDTILNIFKGVFGIPGNALRQLKRVF